jgi:ribosomal protein S18 acetylase RimI-like enzyme
VSEQIGSITVYNPSMAKKVADMFNAFNEIWPGGFGGAIPFDEQRVSDWLDKTSAVADLIALDENEEPVGYCGLYPHWRDENAAYVSIIGVHPRVLGKKFGKRLLLKALEVAVESKITRVDLHTWSGNMEAVPLYKKVGLVWVPETTVYMQDYVPGLLQFPLAEEWFSKHPDWYGCLKKELTQAPDKEVVDNMEIYTYKFEVGEDRLIAEYDRYGWGISSFEKQLDGKKISIKTRISSHEIFMGIQNSMTIIIENKTGEDISTPLNIEPFVGLEWIEEFPSNIEIKNGETFTVTKDFIVNKMARVFESNQKGSEVVKTSMQIENQEIHLVTGGKIQETVKLSTTTPYQIVPLGGEIKLFMDIYNNTKNKLNGQVEYFIDGLVDEKQVTEFSLSAEEITGFSIPIKMPETLENPIFTLQATSKIMINGKMFEMPNYNLPVVADINNLVELVKSPKPDEIYLLTNYWSIHVELEGGNLNFNRRELEGRRQRSSFEIGPPFGLNLDRTLKYEYNIQEDGDSRILVLSGNSRKVEGLQIAKFIKVSPGIREVEQWIELKNITESGSLSAGGRTTAGTGGGISLFPRGNLGRVIIPVNNKYLECDPTLPILSEGLVPRELEGWDETWTAGEVIDSSRYAVWFWSPDNVSKIDLNRGYLNYIESNQHMLEPKEKVKVSHLWFGDSYTSIADVRIRWNQLIGHTEIPFLEKNVGIQTTKPIELHLASSTICIKGKTENKKIEMRFSTTYPFPGELNLILPQDWKGSFVTSEGTVEKIQVPQVIPDQKFVFNVQLDIPKEVKTSIERIIVHFSGEFELDFDIAFLLVTESEIRIEEQEIEGYKVLNVNNNMLEFSLPKEIGGNLLRLKDSNKRDLLVDNFPTIQPFFFLEHFIGGIQPAIFHPDDYEPFGEPEQIKAEIVQDGDWKGVKAVWTVKNVRRLMGQKYSISYLTLPGSGVIRVKAENVNESQRKVRSIASFISTIALDGDAADNTITAPGGSSIWIRNRVPKPFQNFSQHRNPWVRFSKKDQSITFVSAEGHHSITTVFDAQMAIFGFTGAMLETEPEDNYSVEFLVLVNQPEESINHVRKALAKR